MASSYSVCFYIALFVDLLIQNRFLPQIVYPTEKVWKSEYSFLLCILQSRHGNISWPERLKDVYISLLHMLHSLTLLPHHFIKSQTALQNILAEGGQPRPSCSYVCPLPANTAHFMYSWDPLALCSSTQGQFVLTFVCSICIRDGDK